MSLAWRLENAAKPTCRVPADVMRGPSGPCGGAPLRTSRVLGYGTVASAAGRASFQDVKAAALRPGSGRVAGLGPHCPDEPPVRRLLAGWRETWWQRRGGDTGGENDPEPRGARPRGGSKARPGDGLRLAWRRFRTFGCCGSVRVKRVTVSILFIIQCHGVFLPDGIWAARPSCE